MTTTGDRLRVQAAQLRADAEALERSALVMDRQERGKKQATVDATLLRAAKLRVTHKNGDAAAAAAETVRGKNNAPLKGGLSMEERETLIRERLAERPHTGKELHDLLAERGVEVTNSRVYQILLAMPDVRRKGKAQKARWQLKRRRREAHTA